MRRPYLDTNIVVGLIEDRPVSRRAVQAWLLENVGPEGSYVVSDLVRLECRVKPLADGDHELLSAYEEYFEEARAEVVALTAAVCDRAAEIRARERRSLADALHLAAATEAKCDLFVTADQRLSSSTDIPVVVLRPEESG